jgi:orotidine 5'-phosphate decarboxylase subfamily 2
LDPDPARLPEGRRDAEGARVFCQAVLEDTADEICAVKPQSAWFEQYGAAGWTALSNLVAEARRLGIPSILDSKRGDIGETASAYAKAAFETVGADAVTVNPYLGFDGVAPFARFEDRGVFVVCRTSNPSAREFQDLRAGPEAVFEAVARAVARWDRGNLGLVAGATYPQDLARLRSIAGAAMPFLIPGVGAQGGTLSDAALGANEAGEGALVNVSRALLFAQSPRLEARRLRTEFEGLRAKKAR